jgi:D-alanyl-D-alanine carboxypeptidase
VTSASRGGKRLVGAVFGGISWAERDEHMAALMDQGFETLGVAPRLASAVAPEGLRTARLASVGAVPAARAATPARPAARPATQAANTQAASTPARTTTRTTTQRSAEARQVPASSARLPAPPPRPPQPATPRSSPTVTPRSSPTATPPRIHTTQTAPRTASRTSNSALVAGNLPAPRPR